MSLDTNPSDTALAVSIKRDHGKAAIVVRTTGSLPSLSALLPALHNMGLKVSRQDRPAGDHACCELWLEPEAAVLVDRVSDSEGLCGFLQRLFAGEVEDGRLNGLALVAHCSAQEILLIRACASYLRQAGLHLSLRYIAECLRQHPPAVRAWMALFKARLDPAIENDRDDRMAEAASAFQVAQSRVTDADAFDLFGRLRELVSAIVRTNYFRFDERGPLPDYVAFKLDGALLGFLPAPRPYRETFVFSERFEGVHLRGGPVARGGLRWSDRREDYRTEVLGLVKAQLVKNAVIVPTGAKGGFVCKALGPLSSRDVVAAEGREVYRLFISGLLDLTDNQTSDGRRLAPPGVVCHDGADPYLVVAADKGTATFSDLANQVAAQRGFWLGDAFASGGSVGYDHKKLGITAKGAWETAKVRFHEEGVHWAAQGFTAVGIGDMSGDVFGNGALLMPTMRLIAAFDHRHIFIDPCPDVRESFNERSRLFALERSSWDDYDRAKISEGGGVWSRAERSISLSAQAQQALGVTCPDMSPDMLIRAILAAPVTVLFNGGIGTYIKASHETDEAARDRNNDRTRVNASAVRARIVVEGGNLGLTQAARVELAQRGVQVYSDAVDNSGGVDCSDHEVNIKIALGLAAEMSAQQRQRTLESLTGEIERSVLATNREQARRIARHIKEPGALHDPAQYLRSLSERTGLDRSLEGLPEDAALAARADRALLAPELAVVMAHSKMALKTAWVRETPASLASWHLVLLHQYFPTPLRNLPLHWHPLAGQIVATTLANEVVNRMGIGVVERIGREHLCSVTAVLEAYAFACTALCLDGEVFADAVIAALPSAERHEREAEIEAGLAEMVSCVLRCPRLKDLGVWNELRAMFAEADRPPSDAGSAVAALLARVGALQNLRRAVPLLKQGLGVKGAVSLLDEVERETGLFALLGILAKQEELEKNTIFMRWIQRSFASIGLHVAAAAYSIQRANPGGESAVKLALERLKWRDALTALRLVCKTEWGPPRLEKMLNIVAALDEERALNMVEHDAVA